jgi:hypothetical protein
VQSGVQSECRACSQNRSKTKNVGDSEQCLAIFNHNRDEFFFRYIAMDERWLLHCTPESNRQSAEWTERDEPNPNRCNGRGNGIKVMYYIHLLPRKGPDHQQRVLHSVIKAFDRLNQEKTASFEEEKSPVLSRKCTGPQINQNDDGKTA